MVAGRLATRRSSAINARFASCRLRADSLSDVCTPVSSETYRPQRSRSHEIQKNRLAAALGANLPRISLCIYPEMVSPRRFMGRPLILTDL